MIKRVWHGWTTKEKADLYQQILKEHVIPSIENKKIPGYRKMEILRTEHEKETEFVTIMTFDSLKNVTDFQGDDYKRCYVPEMAQKVLNRWDKESTHYELVETINY